MKKIRSLLAVVAVTAAVGACIFGGCNYDTTFKEGDLVKRTSLSVHEDGSFTILQLTDLHLTTAGSYTPDRQTLKWVEEALDTVKPDLVEVTGDAVGGGVKGRNEAIIALANIFEKKQVYWAYTFGNHDGEHDVDDKGNDLWIGKEGKQTLLAEACSGAAETLDANAGKAFYGDNAKGNAQIYELLKGYEYSLLNRSAEEMEYVDEMGVGNYVIELKDVHDNTVFALFHMDSHGKFYVDPAGNTSGPEGYSDCGYVGLTDKQVEWYENKVKAYSEAGIKSALFMHVPSFAYREAAEDFEKLNEYGVPQFKEKENLFAALNAQGLIPEKYASLEYVKREDIYGPRWDEGLSDVMERYPSTTLISVGHDHNNRFIINDDGVLLSYGRTSGVNAWGREVKVGASVFRINTAGQTAEDIYDVSEVYPSFRYRNKGV